MGKHFLLGMLGLVLLAQLPFIFSASCKGISHENQELCQKILNSGLNEEEIELLISNLEYSNKFYPDHDFILEYNTNLQISQPPEGIQKIQSRYIKNAWQDLLTTMPSVLYNGSLYVPSETQVLSAFNYQVSVPENYRSRGYPRTSHGDCKRKYYLENNNARNKIYVNNEFQGQGKLVNANINSDSEIKSEYLIEATIRVKHYKWSGESHSCKYRYTDYQSDRIVITDTLDVKYYENDLIGDLEFIKAYEETTKLRPHFNNSIKITFKDSLFESSEFRYNIEYSKEPYYVYTLKAKEYNQEKINNLFKDGEDILVKDISECKIKSFDFFNFLQKPCTFTSENINFYIKTNKLKYKPDEEIIVEIFPSDISAEIIYNNEIKQAVGSTSFITNSSINKITANYGYYSSEEIIFIEDKNRFKLIWDFSIFGLLNYFFYCVLINYKRKII